MLSFHYLLSRVEADEPRRLSSPPVSTEGLGQSLERQSEALPPSRVWHSAPTSCHGLLTTRSV